MNIGIDIDGVLCSEFLFQLVYGTKFCCDNKLDISKLSPFTLETKDIFKWSENIDFAFWQKYYLHYLTTSEFIYPYCAETIQSWYKFGYKIFIISQRNQTIFARLKIPGDIKLITTNWLKKQDIPFHHLILTEESKESIIKKQKISIMIDDNPHLLLSIQKYTNAICFRSHYNLQCSLGDIPIVSSWKELNEKIEKLRISIEK